MTSIIKLHAFSGVEGEGPPCYLLQVDEFRFLLDCGWDEMFDMEYMENLKKQVLTVDAVLLSYPDPYHLGALPYLVGKCGLNCPIYATIPVYKMGQMFMYDLYQSRHNTEDFEIFTLDDVDAAFDKIVQLKYAQSVGLKGKGHGLQITPLPAGHMLGGTIWKIVKDGEEEIVYAIDYNHKKERHLNGCVLDTIQRPALLITDSYNADYVQPRRRARDEQLLNNILSTMRRGGNVLLGVDTAGRVLELAQMLDQMWRSQGSGLMAYSLAMLNNVSYNVVEFAKSQVEWMSDKIMRAFEDQRNNPFQFRQVQLCHSLGELAQIPEPKVVLASVADMQCGFSRELFLQWSSNPKNTIIITSRTTPGTLARNLIENAAQGQKTIELEVRRRVRLEGAELAEYLKKEKEKETEEARKKKEKAKLDQEDESSDESDAEAEVDKTTGKTKHDLMMKSETKTRSHFFKQAKKHYPMYPHGEERLKWDDYGEFIRPEEYLIIESTPAEEENKEAEKVEDAHMQDVSEIPTKCVSTRQTVEVNATVLFIDFEGRSDGESIKKIISLVKPRQLILVHGDPKSTHTLAEHARGIVQGKIYLPNLNETVDATRESHIFQVRLLDSVVSALSFYKARDAELAWIDAACDLTMAKTDTSARHLEGEHGSDVDMEDEEKAEQKETVPTLLPVPLNKVAGHKAVFVNEPRLSDFKQVLQKEGIQAEFSGGVLICNNVVAVRRNEVGRMLLEGCICDDYYKVQKLLYAQYAIV